MNYSNSQRAGVILNFTAVLFGAYFIITLLFALIIYKVIPQENTKKKLDIIEYKVYRKRGKCILVIELAISIVMHIIDYSIVYTHIMYSFGLIVILLCMSDGYLKRCVKDW